MQKPSVIQTGTKTTQTVANTKPITQVHIKAEQIITSTTLLLEIAIYSLLVDFARHVEGIPRLNSGNTTEEFDFSEFI